MSYRIEFEPAAQREIKALPAHVRAEAREAIRALGLAPRPPRASELRGLPGVWRIWLAGHWRIVYQIFDDAEMIRIVRVRRKQQIDYDSLELPEPEQDR